MTYSYLELIRLKKNVLDNITYDELTNKQFKARVRLLHCIESEINKGLCNGALSFRIIRYRRYPGARVRSARCAKCRFEMGFAEDLAK